MLPKWIFWFFSNPAPPPVLKNNQSYRFGNNGIGSRKSVDNLMFEISYVELTTISISHFHPASLRQKMERNGVEWSTLPFPSWFWWSVGVNANDFVVIVSLLELLFLSGIYRNLRIVSLTHIDIPFTFALTPGNPL